MQLERDYTSWWDSKRQISQVLGCARLLPG
jgi:hypothetical protein